MAGTEFDYLPWLYRGRADATERLEQRDRHAELAKRGEFDAGADVFVSPLAAVFQDRLTMGSCSYVAAHVYLTGEIEMGEHCTLNPYAVARGRVRMGNHVRVGAQTSLLGFNHGFAPDRHVHEQPTTSEGIEVGVDVWIGSHVVVLDGVRIGAHAVVGAGAVVTKDVPDWAVVAGNPARQIKDRRDIGNVGEPSSAPSSTSVHAPSTDAVTSSVGADMPSGSDAPQLVVPITWDARLAAFADRARSQLADVMARVWEPGDELPGAAETGGRFVDRPGAAATARAWCDAIEVSDLLAGDAPPQVGRAALVNLLVRWQDKRTGLVPEIEEAEPPSLDGGPAVYHILSVGYALELLGTTFVEPIHAATAIDSGDLIARLDALPWNERAWSSGAWVDAIGTAFYRNRRDFGLDGSACGAGGASGSGRGSGAGGAGGAGGVGGSGLEALLGWLVSRADPFHGMWGCPDGQHGWLQVVNGFYRASRGTFAQFGWPVPYPERVVDTMLTHVHDRRYFGDDRGNACNVLDVIHPLWLCAQQTDHRRAEGKTWARAQLERALGGWHEGAGFSFELRAGVGSGRTPGLQGTEMWLAIIWLLADYLDESAALGYQPRGVHRPEPAMRSSTTWSTSST